MNLARFCAARDIADGGVHISALDSFSRWND